MLFESTTLVLQDIVHSLEKDDETRWDDHLEFGNQCVYELYQMSRPGRRNFHDHIAVSFDRALRAIPHVKSMNRAVRRKDRRGAIESGKAAIAEMHGMGTARPSALVPPAVESKKLPEPAKSLPQTRNRRTKPAAARAAASNRRPARASAASSR